MDITHWYFIIHKLDDDQYRNGVYFGFIQLPDDFPLHAPRFILFTPNGRFEVERPICLSITTQHENYPPGMNLKNFVILISSVMTGETEGGSGHIEPRYCSKEKRQGLAQDSLRFNREDCVIFKDIFPGYM